MTKKTIAQFFVYFLFVTTAFAQAPRSYTSSEILLQLKKLNTVGSVLYVAAHPDDENTRLIAYLANEKCLRTGYLSLTRGDGGQNLIGPEQGVELGVIRTQELLAARRIDGGEQFFTRAYDFGFSKSPEETLQKWNKDSILSDMVWVIRNFRPDIIITRFATDGSGGHGHHTTSAILAEEAFDAAGDSTRFPEQLKHVEVWKPRRLFWNVSTRFQNPNADMSPYIKLDVGGYNPLLGKSYGEIAAESRSMHKSQGFGSAKQRGEYFEYFKSIKGDTANLKDIFEGIDFSWKRVKGGEKIGKEITRMINNYKVQNPSSIGEQLLKLSDGIFLDVWEIQSMWQEKNLLQQKAFEIENIVLNALGINTELISTQTFYSFDETPKFNLEVISRGTNEIDSINYNRHSYLIIKNKLLKQEYIKSEKNKLYDGSPIWLKDGIKENFFLHVNKSIHYRKYEELFSVGFSKKYRSSNNVSSFNAYAYPQYKWVDPEKGELYRPVVITPPVMINVSEDVLVFDGSGKQKILKVIVKAGKDNVNGVLKFTSSDQINTKVIVEEDKFNPKFALAKLTSFNISPLSYNFQFDKKGEEKEFVFYINSPNHSTSQLVNLSAEVDGQTYTKGIKEIKYDHIPVQTLFPEAEVKLVKLDLVKKSKRIGYIPGAGDEVQACISQLGYEVTTLTDDKLTSENLSQYDAIVTGVRAYNTNEKLPSFKQKLMDYVANGGNLIVQYNTNSWAGPLSSDIGPYKFKITRNRITDEEAKVNFLLPNHPVFNSPNKMTEKDFDGWIQERSIYHAGDWDSNYVAPISMTDPYEMTVGGVSPKGKPDNGALIIAKHGKGNFVYTGFVFFRELPAGVPGAYRFMVNLIELGK